MSQCLNPDCLYKNPSHAEICNSCGSKLILGDGQKGTSKEPRYRALSRLGKGSFSRTFKAIDEANYNSFCVIKQFLPSGQNKSSIDKAIQLFKREAVRLRDLGSHSQIPDLLAFLEQEGKLYLIQEFIDGSDLYKEIKQKGKLTETEVRQFLTNLLPVLEFIHSHQIIHRDIKPENIIRRPDGSLVLIDFGVSKQLNATVQSTVGTIAGTIGYLPPEQLRGVTYPCSDLYALGATAVRLLTGCLPLPNGNDELFDHLTMRWLWHEQGIKVSQSFGEILDKLLADLPTERFQSAKEVMQALSRTNPPLIGTPTLIITPNSSPSLDYTQLKNLLAANKLQQADEETYRLILKLTGREIENSLRKEDFEKIPCQDLKAIDGLWTQCSNNRFGLSVQKRVLQSLGGTNNYGQVVWEAFTQEIGWQTPRGWIDYHRLNFTLQAPFGHLPARIYWLDNLGIWARFSLAPKLIECNIN